MAPGQQAGAGMNMGVMTPAMQAQVSLFRWETHVFNEKIHLGNIFSFCLWQLVNLLI